MGKCKDKSSRFNEEPKEIKKKILEKAGEMLKKKTIWDVLAAIFKTITGR
jgi:hypothetical protein